MALDVDDYYIDRYSTRRRQNILVLLVQPSRELRLVDVSPIHNFESTNEGLSTCHRYMTSIRL